MTLLTRRDLGVLVAAAAAIATAPAYAQQAPYGGQGVKLNVLVDKDLEGFPPQMTRLTLVDLAPGISIPRHYHPAAQEIAFGIDGALTLDVEGQGPKIIKAGDVLVIPAGIPHVPSGDASSATRVLFIHSITDKDKPFRVDLKS